MKTFINFFFAFLTLTFFSTNAFAQLTSSDNLGIYPAAQSSFNPNGKFTAIGESGGAPGDTEDGCDFYGFRAQTNQDNAVNLGMQNIFSNFYVPSLVFTQSRLWIIDKDAPLGVGSGGYGCGQLIGFFGNSTLTNTVLTLNGSAIANGGTWQPSDERLKRNVEVIPNAINIVQNLRGVTYEYRTGERPELGLNEGKQYGFITQEVAEVLPNAVKSATTELGEEADYDVMQYTQVIPVLTEAIKEQQKIITTLEERLLELEARLDDSARPKNPSINAEVGVVTAEGVSLRQNRPNPFQGETVIDYTVPSDMTNAQLVIYNLNGSALASFALDAGNGQVRINATDLSSGVYFYAIENNGQSLVRQKMIVK